MDFEWDERKSRINEEHHGIDFKEMSDDVLSVQVHGREAGLLRKEGGTKYTFIYFPEYDGPPVSLTMPVREEPYRFDRFPPFFDGLLPEGWQLEALLHQAKLDRSDCMGQLRIVGHDTVGAVTVSAGAEEDGWTSSGRA